MPAYELDYKTQNDIHILKQIIVIATYIVANF